MARAATKSARESLSAERIELSALELIEAEGLDGFSTRKLATTLGCEAMSIYHYFPSKGHLMDALVDRVVGSELTVPTPDASTWRRQLMQAAREYRAMALRRPALFAFLALHRFNTPTSLAWLNGMLALFFSLGVGDEMAARLFRVMGYTIVGGLLDETSGYTRGPSTVDPVPDSVMVERYPAVVAAAPWFASGQREKTYWDAVEIVLDGIEAERARRQR